MFMAAFTMLMPLRNSTTLRPDRVPVTNSTPFTEWLLASATLAFSTFHSGSKADTTATRGTVSSRSAARNGSARSVSNRHRTRAMKRMVLAE